MPLENLHPKMAINNRVDNKLTVGLIGLGDISDIHIKAYLNRKDVRIIAMSDVNQGMLLRKGKSFGIEALYPDYNYMLENSEIDVIDVMTPHFLHRECVTKSLKFGKTVICEKPITTNLKDLDEIILASQKYKNDVHLKQYLRYSKVFIDAKKMIGDGKIGRPYFVDCVYTSHAVLDFINNASWKGNILESGGGVFIGNGIHIVDLLYHYFGAPIETSGMFNNIQSALKGKGEDFANVRLKFNHNLSANIVCTENDTGYRFRWEVKIYGTNGIIHIFDERKSTKTLRLINEGKIVYENIEKEWWSESNIRAINDVLDRIKNKERPAIPLSKAKEILNIVLKSYESAKVGRPIKF